jgi:hypothetical protein
VSLILHIIKKDSRFLRYELAIYLLLVLAQAALVLSGVDNGPRWSARSTIWEMSSDLWMLQLVIGGVFAAQLVQGDSLVGTTALWRTRPIARRTLVASKLPMAGFVLLGVPFVVELATCLIVGIGVADSFAAAWGGLVVRTFFLSLALPVAAVTADIPRFAVSLILVLLGASVALRIAAQTVLLPSSDALTPTLRESQVLVFYFLVAACGLAVVVHQYLSLKTVRSVALISIASVACLLTNVAWRHDFLARPELQVDRARFDPDLVTLSLDPVPEDPPEHITRGPRQAPITYIRWYYLLPASGAPTNSFVVPTRTRGTLRFADGAEVASELRATSSVASRSHPGAGVERQRAMLGALKPVAWSNLGSTSGVGVAAALVQVAEAWYRTHQGLASTFTGEVTLAAYAFEITGTMPLKAAAGYRRSSKQADVTSVMFRDNGDAQVVLRELSVERPGKSHWWSTSGQYLLVNQKTREVLFPDTAEVRQALSWDWLGQALPYLKLSRCVLVFRSPPEQKRLVIDEAWLAQAVLVRVEPVSLGSFTKPLKVDNFVLPPLR